MSEQNAAAYTLGVSMGILSFHVTAGSVSETDKGVNASAQAVARLEQTGIDLDSQRLQESVREMRAAFPMDGDEVDFWSERIKTHSAHVIVNLRGEYQGAIESAASRAGRAYELGVAISIAEAQATAGEPARGIVHDSLGKAIEPAKALSLDTKELEEIRAATAAGTGLNDIYMRITNLRGRLGSKLEAPEKPPVIKLPAK